MGLICCILSLLLVLCASCLGFVCSLKHLDLRRVLDDERVTALFMMRKCSSVLGREEGRSCNGRAPLCVSG